MLFDKNDSSYKFTIIPLFNSSAHFFLFLKNHLPGWLGKGIFLPMLKSKLIDHLASKLSHISVHEVDNSVNVLIETMRSALSVGNRIEIRGFGSFSLHYQSPHTARNPKTGKKVITKAKNRAHFKPGKKLRERVNSMGSSVQSREKRAGKVSRKSINS